ELYFEEKNPSISKHIPKNSFHLGSFSKTLAPSLRIGWIRADESLLNPLIPYKEAMDLHTNGISQYILNDYLNNMQQYQEHLNNLREEYKSKMLVFKKYLEMYLPSFKYVEPKGGMFIYGTLEDVDTSKFVVECLKNDVVFVPGIEFYNDDLIKNQIRFNFTHSSPADIREGLLVIKKILLAFKEGIL
ncbi:MAG: aminotransferase class I/II-fold pyridoxal phosphate-dependent enzyme, partial [Arcobacteraceae bacterium]